MQALPASSESCALFLSAMAERGLKVATIEQAMAAIAKAHRAADLPSPRTEAVRAVLGGIRRTLGIAQKQAAPATAVDLRAMVAALPDTMIGKRDAALLLVGFAGAFRRSELAALTRADVRTTENGLEVFLRRSKTDQEGAGRTVALPYAGTPSLCPVRRLQAWLDVSGITEGPLFRYVNRHGAVGPAALSGQAVSEAIRRAARRAGLDAEAFSGHSLRAGFVTQAMLARKADRDIMKQTGHKSLSMLLRYDRRADMWRDNAAAGLLD